MSEVMQSTGGAWNLESDSGVMLLQHHTHVCVCVCVRERERERLGKVT
jgi:hypothetical protein